MTWYLKAIVPNKVECNINETITITAENTTVNGDYVWYMNLVHYEYYPCDVYVDNVKIESLQLSGSSSGSFSYSYTPTTVGEHQIYFQSGSSSSNVLTITVTDPFSISTGSWTVGNKEVSSLTIGGKEVQSIVRVSDDAILYQRGNVPTVLSVTLSESVSNVYVGSSVVLTAQLGMSDDSTPSNKTVTFYNGDTVIGTSTTSNGVATYTYTPTTNGSQSLKAVCDNVESSSVTLTVNQKITLNPSISITPSTVEVGENYTIYGVVRYGSYGVKNIVVKIYNGNNELIDTITTTQGLPSFTKTITASTSGSISYYFVTEETSQYNSITSNAATVTITEPVQTANVDSVILTGDKSILSFKHDDECVLTATVYDDSSTPVPLEDKAVNFKIGNNVIGSAVTDSNGEATYTYKSRGANNITITAECETESDTFSIEDNWIYLTGATDYSPYWNMDNNSSGYFTLTTENNQYKHIKTQSDTSEVGQYIYPVEDIGLKSFEATAKVYWTCGNVSSYNHLFQVRDPSGMNSIQVGTWSSSKILGYIINSSNKRYNPSGRLSTGTWYIFKAKYDHNNGIVYTAIIDESSGNIVAQNTGNDTFTITPYRLFWAMLYSNSTNYLKELKVQSLTTQTDYYNVSVTGDAEILSAYNNDTMTVTVTVTDVDGEPVSNQSVELFYQGETQATSTTNNNGVATFTYTATGFGNASVYAYVGTSVGKYDFIDAKYYGSNSDVFGFACSYPVQFNDKIHFRFHSLPTHTIIGIGNASTSDYVLEKNGDTYKYHRNPSSVSKTGTPSSAHAFEVGKDYIFIKNNKTSPSRTEIFKNNTYVDWWTSGNSANRIRVDKYANDDFDIEVFVL